MPNTLNHKVILASRPVGIPQTEHFKIVAEDIPEPGPDEFLLRNHFLSIDPAMRGWVNDAPNYSDPVGIGEVMRSIAVGEVIASRNGDYAVGDRVVGLFGWQEFAVGSGKDVWFRVSPGDSLPSASLGILGLNGVTAYFCLLELGRPKEGETVVISTAAGSVGSAAGQIAKIKGCRTVGITGSDEKVRDCVDQFGYDIAINYKSTEDLGGALAKACPDGVDVYFDNTAGAISDAVYEHLNIGARCVICGTASVASWDPWPGGPRIERHLLVKRASVQGFLVFDYLDRIDEARQQLTAWLREGELTYREEILEGLDQAPGAIARLYAGENRGKLVIRLAG